MNASPHSFGHRLTWAKRQTQVAGPLATWPVLRRHRPRRHCRFSGDIDPNNHFPRQVRQSAVAHGYQTTSPAPYATHGKTGQLKTSTGARLTPSSRPRDKSRPNSGAVSPRLKPEPRSDPRPPQWHSNEIKSNKIQPNQINCEINRTKWKQPIEIRTSQSNTIEPNQIKALKSKQIR